VGSGMFFLFYIEKKSNKKIYRKGVEHGSAEWGDPKKDLKGMYIEDNDFKNIIFTEKTKLAVNNSDLSHHKYHRNKNAIIVGGSGSGKTRFFVKPNLMQMNSDYVITDPKGDILNDLGYMLRAKENYDIKVLNLIDFDKSMRYNPFDYIEKEQDILKLVETIIKNTSAKDAKEDFWVTAEKLLYQTLISVILDYFPKEEQHLGTLADLIALFEVKENDEDYLSVVDEMFLEIAEHSPNAFCVKQYNAFKKVSAGETAKSILISCATRLAPINIPAVRELLSSDELQLKEIGNKPLLDKKGRVKFDKNNNIIYQPTALFLIIPDTDTTFNFIASIMYTQMFNQLVTIADTQYNGELPRHIRFILDEFANIGEIPQFHTLIATIRSRNISATPILQTLAQLKEIYKDKADTIIGNCDTLMFLGGKEENTLKLLSSQLGKQTIDDYNTSRTRSQSDSFGQNYSKLGRELMTPDELQKMDRSKAIVMITNLPPFIDNKYDITKHQNYKYHGKPPVINKRTGEVIKEGEFWFDTDKYIHNYRKIYNKKFNSIYDKDLPEVKNIKENEGKNEREINYEYNYNEVIEKESLGK
jgi:type IV secretion system protein VirD4